MLAIKKHYLNILLISGAIFIIVIFILIKHHDINTISIATSLSPVGIILASFIASASVMKSIEANKILKEEEIMKVEKSQLLFMKYICKQIKSKTTMQWGTSNKSSMLQFTKVKVEINEVTVLWEKLVEERYFVFISEKGYKYFNEISVLLNGMNYHINNFGATEEEIDTLIFDLLKEYNMKINSNVNSLLDVLQKYKEE
jgi:hypothetical protein